MSEIILGVRKRKEPRGFGGGGVQKKVPRKRKKL
jgi:hypothetical protein